MATLSGKVIGNYEILEEIGRGAMGVVFKAKQLSMDRVVALKFLPKRMAQDEKRVQRFIREARAAGKLSHPNIVSVHDVGQAGGMHYISMEYVDGASAHTRVKKNGPMKEADAVELGLQIAGALKMAHDNGILHRDVKPDNFLLDSSGRARLADLGLARFETGESDDAHLTQEGTALGTPHYMAPEQARGEKVDHRSDLYSLGASLYVLASGKTPFEGPTAAVILVNVLQKDPVPLRRHAPHLSPGFCAVVEKLMAKSPDARFKDARAVVEALEQVRAGVYAAPGGSGTGLRRPTTGPHSGVKATTGPQSPLRSASTGPVGRIGPRTMAASRRGKSGGSPALFAGLGIGAAALLLVLLFAMGGGGTPAKPRNASNDEIPAAPANPTPARNAAKTPAASASQAPRPTQTDFAARNERPEPAYTPAPVQPAQPAQQPSAGFARAEEDAKSAFRAGQVARALDGLTAFAQGNAGSTEGQQARRLNETLGEQAREWARARLAEAQAAEAAKDFEKAGGTLAFLQQNLPQAMRDELKVGEALARVQAAASAVRRARFGEALKSFEAPALSGQYAKASETAGALRRDPALAGFEKETDALPDLLDAVKKVDAAALQGLDTLRKAKPELRIVTLRSGALEGIVTKVDGEKVELRIGSDDGAPVTAFKGGELGCRFRLQLSKQAEPATPADWIARAALYANADALSPEDTAAAKRAVESAKGHPLAPYYAARLDERARALDADPARKAWAAIELASDEDLDAAKKKDLAAKLADFEAQFGNGEFAKSKAEQIAALKQRLGLGAGAAAAAQDANKTAEGDAAAGKAELEKKGWKVTGDWINDPKRPGAFHVKGGGKIEWAKTDAALQVFVQPAQEGAAGVYVRYDAEALGKFRQSLGGFANFIGGALDEVKDGYGVRVAGGGADVYGPKNPIGNGPGRGGRGRGGRGFGGERMSEVSEAAGKLPGKTSDAQVAGGVRVVVAVQGDKLTVQVNGRNMNTGGNTPRGEGGAAIVVEGDADVMIEKQQ